MGIRIALGIILTIGCTLLGRAFSNAARRRLACLGTLISGCKILRIHITGMRENVSQALILSNCALMTDVGREMKTGCSAWEAWENLEKHIFRRGDAGDALLATDRDVLNNLFSSLGESGRSEQEVLISDTIRMLQEREEAAKLVLSEKDRLYVTVGFLFGLIIAIAIV